MYIQYKKSCINETLIGHTDDTLFILNISAKFKAKGRFAQEVTSFHSGL